MFVWSSAAWSLGGNREGSLPSNIYANPVHRFRRSKVEGAIVRIAPSAVGGNLGSHNGSQMLAALINYPDTAGSGCIYVSPFIEFHPIDGAFFRRLQISQHPLAGERTGLAHLESIDLSPARVADVKGFFIRREADPVGQSEIAGFER